MAAPDYGLISYDKTWSLFLDRDGVLNRRIVDDYVKQPAEFEWLPGVLPALRALRPRFARIVVVTNQQGVGKGVMSSRDLEAVHHRMRGQAAAVGVAFDGVYVCTALEATRADCRKPRPGMAYTAQAEFPDIDFEKSIMVGDSPSDIAFGRSLGMTCVGIGERVSGVRSYACLWDWAVQSIPVDNDR